MKKVCLAASLAALMAYPVFAQDAAKVAASLTGAESREATARAELARDSLKLA